MLNKRINIYKGLPVLLVAACYLFITLTHIFFLPKLTHSASKHTTSYNSVYKRRVKSLIISSGFIFSLHRIHKVILNERKEAMDILKSMISFFVLLFFAMQAWRVKFRIVFDLYISPGNYQYSYLSFCTFKI